MFERANDENRTERHLGCFGKFLVFSAIWIVLNGVFFYWIGKSFMDYTPNVTLTPHSIYRIDMKGNLLEQGTDDYGFKRVFNQYYSMNLVDVVGLDDLLRNIRFAKENDNIDGIFLCGGTLSMGAAKAKELRDALLDFKKSGKWIYSYAENYGLLNYYVASVSDSIFINPVGTITWDGLSAHRIYYHRLLNKLGIEVQVFKVGSYKSAVEPFERSSMSDEDRQQTQQYIDGIWSVIKHGVSKTRHITSADLDKFADQVFSAQSTKTYLTTRLVDALHYRNSVDSFFHKKMTSASPTFITTDELLRVSDNTPAYKDKIAVIYAEGPIVERRTSETSIVKNEILKQIKKVLETDNVKGVVFRVNSPGGSADASEQIWHGMTLFKDKGIPVVVSMSDYAASGGYYISACADYIFAQPSTITGSIGIFGIAPNVKKPNSFLGIDYDGVKTNAHSDIYSNLIFAKVSKEEKKIMQDKIERGYELFVKRCAQGRHKSTNYIKSIAQGHVWLGNNARENGLVDKLGGIEDAISKAAELAKIQNYSIVCFPKRNSYIDELVQLLDRSSDEEKLISRIKNFLSEPRILYLAPVVEMNKN